MEFKCMVSMMMGLLLVLATSAGTTGFVSGTAPFCGGVCADCGDGHCYHVEKGSVSDYGHGCTSGNKVCCCSKEMEEFEQPSKNESHALAAEAPSCQEATGSFVQ